MGEKRELQRDGVPGTGTAPAKAPSAKYIPTGEVVSILKVHHDRNPVCFTVVRPDGSIREVSLANANHTLALNLFDPNLTCLSSRLLVMI